LSFSLPEYEVFALKYAKREGRRSENFVGGDPHDAPMPMDYFVWVVKGGGRLFVVDTGFTEKVAQQRKRTFLRCPVRSLGLLGIDAATVEDVILTHLHYDHVGNFSGFPRARFHLQEKEMGYATGRYMKYPYFSHAFEADDIVGMVQLNFAGRVEFYNGAHDLAPGLALHPAPGHTAGLQIVRVHTARGWLVLASDATHYYENFQTNRMFSTAFHLSDMVDSYRLLEQLAVSPECIVPGHDPLVMRHYPPASPELDGIAVRLDVAPRTFETDRQNV
jgi:glyoxylase-like metal-dependent hydrolase (beta-lactamase superfamily II)